MRNLNIKKHFFTFILLIIGIYWIYNYFDNQNNIEKLDFGVNANELRKSLNIPIIDESMNSDNGYKWQSWREKPKQNEILHVWKNVTPSKNKKFILDEEIDAFRVKESNGRIRQLNIYSKTINDSVLNRTGRTFYNTEPRETLELNETGVDSVVKRWELNNLSD